MMYHAITTDDMKNGDGLRVVLWVAGCQHKCPGCHNPQTWNAEQGEPFTEWEEAELFRLLKQKHIAGITFSGGDPLHPANRDEVGKIAKKVKQLGKNVWLYTGYMLEHSVSDGFFLTDLVANLEYLSFEELPWLSYVDVLVDGRFMEDIRKEDIRKNADPHWRGSSNQRVIDMQRSFETGHIVHVDGMVESDNVLYNSIINRYSEFDELVDSSEQMLKLLNILEAHEETLENLHSVETGQQFCHAWPKNCKDGNLVSSLFEQNKFFYSMGDFYRHYEGCVNDEIVKVVSDAHNNTYMVYYASNKVIPYDEKNVPDEVISLMQERRASKIISSAVSEWYSNKELLFEKYISTGDIIITSDGYVHVNIA